MAQDTFVRDWSLNGEKPEEDIIHYLNEIQKQYNTVTCFFVSDNTRKYYHPTGVLKKVSETDPQDTWYFRVKNMSEDYEINVDIDTADNQSLNIFINYRVYDFSGNFIGVTGVGLAVNSVQDLIDIYQEKYGRQVYFADLQGQITLSSTNYNLPENIRQISGLSKVVNEILASDGYSGIYTNDGKTVYLNSRLVPEFGWYLLVEQVETRAETRIQYTLFINLAVSLIITVIVLFLANLIIGGYQRRLEKMATTDKLTGIANRQIFHIFLDSLNGTSPTLLNCSCSNLNSLKEVFIVSVLFTKSLIF